MKVKKSSTSVVSYRVQKHDLAEVILGKLGECFVTVDANLHESYVTVNIRRDEPYAEVELDS